LGKKTIGERMRVGIVTGEFPPMQGGVGAFSQELARALAARGHELHIFTHREARPEPAEGRYSLAQLREPLSLDYATLYPHARRWRWADVAQLADVALRYDLEVVNIQYQAAAYNMRSAAINLAPWRLKGLALPVVTFHDLRVPYLFPKAGPVRRMAVEWMARLARGVIVTNAEDYEALRQAGITQERMRNIPIGSNVQVHSRDEDEVLVTRRKLHVRPGDCLLGYFGFLNESKGADVLLEALARLEEDVHLVFIGGRTGSSDTANNQAFLDKLDAQIGALGLRDRVHWTGFVDDRAVSAYLNASDLMVLPYRDGVSLRRGTLMAALAHGRPIVSTESVHDVAPLVHGENIWLVAREDAQALAAAVRMLRHNGTLRQALGDGARKVADCFSWERIAEASERFFAELLSEEGG
jgi:glycosyltransferase involved in cell wall biosynthesis